MANLSIGGGVPGTNSIANTQLAQAAANTLKGNPTAALANVQDFTITSLANKAAPVAGDLLIIEDSEDGGNLKEATVGSIASAGSVASIAGNTGAFTLDRGLTNVGNALLVDPTYFQNYLSGLTLSNDGTDPTNDIGIAVGVAADSTNARLMKLGTALIKRLDAGWAVGTNQGGLDTGGAGSDTYHVWLIARSDTGVVDVLFSISATAPTMPANYDFKRRIGSILNVSAAIVLFTQIGDTFIRTAIKQDINSTTAGTSAVTRTLAGIPTGVVFEALFNATVDIAAGTSETVLFTSLFQTDALPSGDNQQISISPTAGSQQTSQAGPRGIFTNTSAQIRSRQSVGTANTTLRINTYGWVDLRGR